MGHLVSRMKRNLPSHSWRMPYHGASETGRTKNKERRKLPQELGQGMDGIACLSPLPALWGRALDPLVVEPFASNSVFVDVDVLRLWFITYPSHSWKGCNLTLSRPLLHTNPATHLPSCLLVAFQGTFLPPWPLTPLHGQGSMKVSDLLGKGPAGTFYLFLCRYLFLWVLRDN